MHYVVGCLLILRINISKSITLFGILIEKQRATNCFGVTYFHEYVITYGKFKH